MGVFSSKKKTIVGLTTVPLIEEQKVFNESTLAAVFSNTSISESIAAEYRNGWLGKANQFYRRTKSKLNTVSGSAVFTSFKSNSTLEETLENIIEPDLIIYKYSFSPLDVTYYAYKYLIENAIIDVETDIVTYNSKTYTFESSFVENNLLKIILKNEEEDLVLETDEFTQSDKEYLHVIYAKESTPTILSVWFYDVENNTYPQISNNFFSASYNDYFPSIIIRKDKVNTVDLNNEYSTEAEKIVKYMGSDLKFITEQLLTNEEGQSDVVDDAFLTFGLNIQDPYEGSINYLYEYFLRIYQDIPDSKSLFNSWYIDRSITKPEYSIKYTNDGFNSYIEWNYISYDEKVGTIPSKFQRITNIVSSIDIGKITLNRSELVLRKRLTENTYAEIVVHGLYHVSEIVNNKYVIRTLEDSLNKPTADNEADSGFYIPLSRTVVNSLQLKAKKQVLYASFIIPIYTVQVVKIKWYQRGAFKIVLYIVAIIVTIYTTDFSGSSIQAVAAIAANIVTSIIISQALRIVVDIIGIESALILAVVAAAVAIYNGGYSNTGLPWAADLLQLATLSFSAISAELQDAFKKLQTEISDFLTDAQTLKEDIERAESLLDTSKYDLLDLKSGRLYFNPYETPDQFYTRSVYEQNPGVKSFDLLYNYVDRMLKLPEYRHS